MKKIFKMALVALAAVAMVSCGPTNEVSGEKSLIGRWQNDKNPGWYRVFTNDKVEDDVEFCWGKEWDETDGVFEADLKEHGNGWFKWHMEQTKSETNVIEWEMMEFGWADIAYEYKITLLNDESLAIEEKGTKRVHTFKRVK